MEFLAISAFWQLLYMCMGLSSFLNHGKVGGGSLHVHVCQYVHVYILLLTLGAHAQRGLR